MRLSRVDATNVAYRKETELIISAFKDREKDGKFSRFLFSYFSILLIIINMQWHIDFVYYIL